MRSSWASGILVTVSCFGGGLAFVDDAWAYKVTTHQVVAVRSAERLPDGDLKTVLLGNELYLRSGAMGPDLFLLLGGGSSYPSHLAHYCKTDELAKHFLSLSKSRSGRAQAFAYGWFSHNIVDSVAHPWVNGFTGQPYAAVGATRQGIENLALNASHIGIEAWVDKQVFTQMGTSIPRRYSQAKALVAAFDPFIADDEIQQLFIDAYEATYNKQDCIGKRYEKLTKEEIAAAGKLLKAAIGADKFGTVVKDFVDPKLFELDLRRLVMDAVVREILRTWEDYLDRSVQYLEKSWQATGALPNFNLDQGVEKDGNDELAEFWGTVLDPEGRSVSVFDVPGKRYNDGRAPEHDDRCVARDINPACSQAALLGPGGDNPDDAVATGIAVAGPSRSVADAHWRLATKKGKHWPSLFGKLSREAEGLGAITDPAAFLEAFAASGEAFDKAREADPEFGAMTSSYHGDPRPFDGAADVALLASGFASEAQRVIQSFLEPALRMEPSEIAAELVRGQPILVIPSGALSGGSTSEQLRAGLEAYVGSGGTAIVFAQQRGSDFSVLPTPDGRLIRGWGWHEDNSCYWNGAFVETFHPILASQSEALVTSAIDGFFDSIPENAIVLLRRVKNNQPAMFMYPYGEGWVIVSSSYDDWGGFNQSTPGARAIIRDAITWAKKPVDLPLNAPGSTVSITLRVKNVTDLPASQVKLILMSPSRDRVAAEQTVGVSVAAGGTAEAPFSHAFPLDAELGIYHLDYELLDESAVTVQPVAEEDTGRIVVAKPPSPGQFRPADLTLSILAPGGEDFLFDDPVNVRYRLVNRKDSARRSPALLGHQLAHGRVLRRGRGAGERDAGAGRLVPK